MCSSSFLIHILLFTSFSKSNHATSCRYGKVMLLLLLQQESSSLIVVLRSSFCNMHHCCLKRGSGWCHSAFASFMVVIEYLFLIVLRSSITRISSPSSHQHWCTYCVCMKIYRFTIYYSHWKLSVGDITTMYKRRACSLKVIKLEDRLSWNVNSN